MGKIRIGISHGENIVVYQHMKRCPTSLLISNKWKSKLSWDSFYNHSTGNMKKFDDIRGDKAVKQKMSQPLLVKIQIGTFTLGKFGSTCKKKHTHNTWPGNFTLMHALGRTVWTAGL